jgi:hypothetical protein
MARRKTLPESVRAKYSLAERLSVLRAELFGERGGPELARRLGLPVRTWYNYEGGVTVPAEVVLKIIELTSVEPHWLLHGIGPKYRDPSRDRAEPGVGSTSSVGALLRTAIQILEKDEKARHGAQATLKSEAGPIDEERGTAPENVVLIAVGDSPREALTRTTGPHYLAARREWLDAERDCRCIRVSGEAMSPIVADGAYVAFSKAEDDPLHLDGKLVVAWVEGQPIVRWFQHCGRYALLRAENPATEPTQLLIDLEGRHADRRFRKVLWINTPH